MEFADFRTKLASCSSKKSGAEERPLPTPRERRAFRKVLADVISTALRPRPCSSASAIPRSRAA